MAYIPSECSIEEYENQIYSGENKHRLYIKQGENILDNASPYASNLVWKRRLFPNGSRTFSIGDFVSQEIELALHDYQFASLTDDIEIKIGTYIDSVQDYVYVPLGVYKIQDNPTTDQNKTSYKLRDKSVNFDFNYNAKDLIDASEHEDESGNKYVTKLEIVQDICSKANVQYVGTQEFIGHDDRIAIYDNTITARKYISFIFEQAGMFVFLNRFGQLDCINPKNLATKIIDANLVENFTKGDTYLISKIVYESGDLYWENGTDDKDKLYINGTNPYITKQEDIDRLSDLIDFSIDSFRTGSILGNPTFDPWDLLQITYNDIIYTTLAQYTLTFNGVMTNRFDTTINLEAKNTNNTKNSEAQFKKYVKSEIDNVNASLTTTVGTVESLTTNTQDIENTLKQTTETINELSTTVTQNNQTVQTQITQINNNINQGVETLRNTLVTIDINGISVAYSEESFKSLITNKNFQIKDGSNEIAFFGYDENLQKTIARIKELETERLTSGNHRCEPFVDDATNEERSGWFYIGGVR